jgi:hypothetical protein
VHSLNTATAQFIVNDLDAWYQSRSDVTALAGGNFVVVWRESSNRLGDASGQSVVAGLYAADGTRLGTDFRVNTTTPGNQSDAAVFALPGGGFRIVWHSEDYGVIPLRHMFQDFDAAGTPVGPEVALPLHTAYADGTLAAYGAVDGTGAQAFLALDRLTPTDSEVQLVRVDAAGVPTLLTGDATGPAIDVATAARHLLAAVEAPGAVWISGMRMQLRLLQEGEELAGRRPDRHLQPARSLGAGAGAELFAVAGRYGDRGDHRGAGPRHRRAPRQHADAAGRRPHRGGVDAARAGHAGRSGAGADGLAGRCGARQPGDAGPDHARL